MYELNLACGHYKLSYIADSSCCKNCCEEDTCEIGNGLLQQVTRAPMEALPVYLVHEHKVIRKTAKMRMNELCTEKLQNG